MTSYYTTLANTTAAHNYFDKEGAKHYNLNKIANGPHVKVANGNLITPFAQATA